MSGHNAHSFYLSKIGGIEMANLKRNMIELVKNPDEVVKGGEVEMEKFWTPPFLPLTVTYEAIDIMEKIEKDEKEGTASPREFLELMMDFVANKAYGGQFTKEELQNKLHAPDAIEALQSQVLFIAQGQQSTATKNFLEKKR